MEEGECRSDEFKEVMGYGWKIIVGYCKDIGFYFEKVEKLLEDFE